MQLALNPFQHATIRCFDHDLGSDSPKKSLNSDFSLKTMASANNCGARL
jgi:hypothetical protein